ncbi:MAG TPA: HIT family protein [Ignavibacteria bacterium]|nr:HIT family protein [Ignavibacteria bacterium]HMR41960.1 HIT family protein [Ignavibacteria bacterium]
MKQSDCIFCNIGQEFIILKNDLAFAIKDKYPHSRGHLLVIPFEHEENYFELCKKTRDAMNDLLIEAKKYCDEKYKPPGYKISVNIGRSAGQVVMHAHLHLIPGYS